MNQLNQLRRLSNVSKEVFGHDKSAALYTDNLTVFDTLLKTKVQLNGLLEEIRLKEEQEREAQRLLFEQKQRENQPKPPVFIHPLINGSVQAGESFTFKCNVQGTPAPNVEWFKGGAPIQNNAGYQATFNNGLCTLTIVEALATDAATFSCSAANVAGRAETTASLSVVENVRVEKLEAPVFTKPLTTGFAREGDSFVFECTVTGHPLPIVQWYKNSNCIDQLPDYTITYNNGQANLQVDEVFLADQTTFTCRASNPVGTAETSANLIVDRKFIIIS